MIVSAPDVRRHAVLGAVKGGEIRPAFQPIIRLREQSLAGFEALARWDSPTYGSIAPSTFIPWAEEDGLINALTHGLVSSACAAAAAWGEHFFLCFNISPLQFNGSDLVSVIFSAVDGTGFSRHRLVMEMTETSAISETRNAHEMIGHLSKSGVRIALDDFGTGHSGLSRLLSFPFYALKIDKTFVRTIEADADARMIVSAIVGLCDSLGLKVVAEGIERPEQLAVLQELGCTYGQGWLLGREMTPAAAAHFAEGRKVATHYPETAVDLAEEAAKRRLFDEHVARGRLLSRGANLSGLDILFGLSDIGLCQVDLHMTIVRVNETLAALFHKHVHDLQDGAVKDVLPADFAGWLWQHAGEIGASDDTFVYSLAERSGRAIRLRVRRMLSGGSLTGILIMAVPN
ncbi:EAL domain-containing protein [Pseudochelatococcus contaminans]|uniref:EAL domain-containing protein (Putative c-di-GMP-specific phosphodiesterase class I) n=1 Tax=Pseudochelatococcus contaminans TaxID=1538103 RepID=A0A7W6EFK7_9HYPH|nr:EAL domain-containing protein [Pseudochelatococcus contaminans]MBB3808893.1 EAL domain-containing protein (putative c-di-GMP-specific phosphodiesterase class I) [Pseudochelatococcus contaminans]